MARTPITVTQAGRAGVVWPAAVAGDVVNGNSMANNGQTVLVANNTGASSRNVTFTTVRSVDGLTAPTRQEAIPAGETQLFGPFDPTDYGTSLAVNVDNAEVTLRAVRI